MLGTIESNNAIIRGAQMEPFFSSYASIDAYAKSAVNAKANFIKAKQTLDSKVLCQYVKTLMQFLILLVSGLRMQYFM